MEREVIEVVNNSFYDDLKEKWYEAYDHPIALLRAENKARIPWVAKKIAHIFSSKKCSVIDIGCGAGFLSNALAQYGHQVTGLDISEGSLEIARKKDVTHSVFYCYGNGCTLPFSQKQFDVACAMDLLEHVEQPAQVIAEASRVLKPGGVFFFHTFNRNWFSWLFALKGVEWFVPNTPPNIHVYRLFIKPCELAVHLGKSSLIISELLGLMPTLNKSFFKLIFQRRITEGFTFKIVSSSKCGYMGCAIKR